MDFWEILLGRMDLTLLIFARILGIFSFNPILSRNNIPVMVRVGISLFTAEIICLSVNFDYVSIGPTAVEYVFAILRELLIGIILGAVCDLFILGIQFAGEIMDNQSGLGMAKVFDPSTKIQMSVFGSIASFMFYLYFFATNSHLTLIHIFVESFEAVPLGTGTINGDFGWTFVEMFASVMVLMMKLSLPIIAAEFIVEFSVGLMMKAVPQIQIMVVNIQLKVIVGFTVLFLIAAPLGEFIQKYMDNMLGTCREVLPLIMS